MRAVFLLWAMCLAMLGSVACAQSLRPVTVASGLDHPWGLAFLPEGRMLVTERPGRLRIVSMDGKISEPIGGVPEVAARGQGGLLDVVLDPKFTDNRLVYLSYSEPGTDDMGRAGNGTAVARARLEGQRLADLKVIFRQQPKVNSTAHFGSRLAFARDGRLLVTLGERYSRREDAQTLDTHHGKVVRINPDGTVPTDNPYVARAGALPEIWNIGHRNMQGAAIHPATGELWSHEDGPQGGDELNIELPGRNYGWPVITYGREYVTGLKIGEGATRADVEPPLKVWIPSIAPSGMAFLTSDRYPGWKGNLFIGALAGQALVRLELDGRKVVSEERLLQSLGERIRDVRQGPDGWLYLLTDDDNGRILRIER
jgi:glucose/arabinose dehydrogenase